MSYALSIWVSLVVPKVAFVETFSFVVVPAWPSRFDHPCTMFAIVPVVYENVKPMKLVRPFEAAVEFGAPPIVWSEMKLEVVFMVEIMQPHIIILRSTMNVQIRLWAQSIDNFNVRWNKKRISLTDGGGTECKNQQYYRLLHISVFGCEREALSLRVAGCLYIYL